MKRTISIVLVLVLLSFSSGHAVPNSSATKYSKRISDYRNAAVSTHPRYLVKIEAVKTRLKNTIPLYTFGSFYGACPNDTLWATNTIQTPAMMAEIYAENHVDKTQDRQPVQVAFTITEGEIFFQGTTQLGSYKANPEQNSVVRVTSTVNGPRIAATTALTPEGMTLQATAGCIGCHSS